MAQAVGVIGMMSVILKLFGLTVKLAQSAVLGTDPQHRVIVFRDGVHPSSGQARRIVWIVLKADKSFRFPFEPVEPLHGADIKFTLAVCKDRPDFIVAKAVFIRFIVFVYGKPVSIIPIQSVPGSKPHQPPLVLRNGKHRTLGKPVFNGQVFKLDIYLRPGRQCIDGRQNPDDQH